ncbi:hypothetical protein EWB00_003858 [Schistosoma japonicum]|uniref:Uncharacterized protein n=1 Tax=Schistosoma japonicum TaxID=6182 RepID=A0A4Z2D757_SCHJA|nr:hypothetical protein EWB00_003858 [Schistosoma japonicum]
MASSLFKSRPEYIPPPKFYGYKSISLDEEKQLIERLSKPTISIIQAQLKNNNNNNVNLIEYDNQTLRNPIITSPTLSSNSSNHFIESISTGDYENVTERLQKLSEIWNKTERINPFLPLCACIRGELLLKENNNNSLMNTYCHCSTTCSSLPNRYTLNEPIEWKKLNKIVRRLHSANTAGSIARQKESHALLTTLSKQHYNHSINSSRKSNKIQKNIFNPELKINLFDNKGQFKLMKYIHQWEIFQQVNHKIIQLSRPTTSSKLKCRGYCILCNNNNLSSTITSFNAFTNYSINNNNNNNSLQYKTFHLINNKKQQQHLIERLIQPTIASQGNKCHCDKFNSFNVYNKQLNNGELIMQRLQQLNKQLPLISGLQKSSSINSIINRLYSGKCRRSNCLYAS